MIEQTKTKIIYNVGESLDFPFNIRFFEKSDLKVKLNDRILELNKDYEVEDKTDYSTGATITLRKEAAAAIGDRLLIQRDLPLRQLLDLPEYGKISAEDLEAALDRIVMSLQELADNSIIYNGEDTIDFDKMIKDLIAVQDYVANADELSISATKAAVSAAQALISAMNAAKYAEEAKSVSGIDEHNKSQEAHADIRELISTLDEDLEEHKTAFADYEEKYEKHVATYESHITENQKKHAELETRINEIASNKQQITGNYFETFGKNNNGQLGVSDPVINVPTEHIGLRNTLKIATSEQCGVAISGSRLYVSGVGTNGFCGGDLVNCKGFKPHPHVDNIFGWTDVACDGENAMGICNGALYSWGKGASNLLGDGSISNRTIPRIVSDLEFKKVAAGVGVMLALAKDGNVYSCGRSSYGALGHGISSQTSGTLLQITSLDNVIDIAVGGVTASNPLNFCAAIKKVGNDAAKLYTWGYNGQGQLGRGDTNNINAPLEVVDLGFEPFKVVCGAKHIAVLSSDKEVYVAGDKAAFLGTANSLTFKKIEFESDVIDIAAGFNVTYLLTSFYSLYGFGTASNSNLLDKSSTAEPISLVASQKIEKIFSGCQIYGCSYTIAEEGTDSEIEEVTDESE